MVGEMDLEAGHAWKRAGRRADLRREVGKRREVVPEDGRLRVKRSPVSCIPSPESPANRITTRSRCSTGLLIATFEV